MEHGLFGWLFLVVGLVFLFGNPKRLSDLGRGMGSFLREFRSAQKHEPEDEAPKTLPPAEKPRLDAGNDAGPR